jgi:hypothetical protein
MGAGIGDRVPSPDDFDDRARRRIVKRLLSIPQGRILSEEELKQLRAWFPNQRFGELIFLAKEGVLIVPSDMGERPLRAMHGYHPDEKHSYAALFTNQPVIPEGVTAIPHIHGLMVKEAKAAQIENHGGGRAPAIPARRMRSWPVRPLAA